MLVVHIIVHNENYIYRLVEIVIRSIYIINLAIKSINRHAGLDPASSRFHYGFRLEFIPNLIRGRNDNINTYYCRVNITHFGEISDSNKGARSTNVQS